MNLGYCCINLTLKEDGVSTNRGMIKRTFQERGKSYAGELALKNIEDLFTILNWNEERGVKVFRISSSLFPWMSEYKFEDLPQWREIKDQLKKCGDFILEKGHRVGFHPGQFCVLPSPTPKVVAATIDELDKHSIILDTMGLPRTPQYSLNIHVGGSYGDKESTLKRFCENWNRLSETTKGRLVIENDDKASQYSVKDLWEGLYKEINIPITFDFFHHTFCTGGLTTEVAAHIASSTWPDGIRPLAHYSSSKKKWEDESVIERSHADYLYERIPDIGSMFDIEIEAKSKELSLFKYLNV